VRSALVERTARQLEGMTASPEIDFPSGSRRHDRSAWPNHWGAASLPLSDRSPLSMRNDFMKGWTHDSCCGESLIDMILRQPPAWPDGFHAALWVARSYNTRYRFWVDWAWQTGM